LYFSGLFRARFHFHFHYFAVQQFPLGFSGFSRFSRFSFCLPLMRELLTGIVCLLVLLLCKVVHIIAVVFGFCYIYCGNLYLNLCPRKRIPFLLYIVAVFVYGCHLLFVLKCDGYCYGYAEVSNLCVCPRI